MENAKNEPPPNKYHYYRNRMMSEMSSADYERAKTDIMERARECFKSIFERIAGKI